MNPIDLTIIEEKLTKRKYRTREQFVDDFNLLINNCYEYNGRDSEYSDMAKILEKCFKKAYKKHVPPDESDLDSSDEEFAESKRWKKPADNLPSRGASRPTRAASSRAREALLYTEMGGSESEDDGMFDEISDAENSFEAPHMPVPEISPQKPTNGTDKKNGSHEHTDPITGKVGLHKAHMPVPLEEVGQTPILMMENQLKRQTEEMAAAGQLPPHMQQTMPNGMQQNMPWNGQQPPPGPQGFGGPMPPGYPSHMMQRPPHSYGMNSGMQGQPGQMQQPPRGFFPPNSMNGSMGGGFPPNSMMGQHGRAPGYPGQQPGGPGQNMWNPDMMQGGAQMPGAPMPGAPMPGASPHGGPPVQEQPLRSNLGGEMGQRFPMPAGSGNEPGSGGFDQRPDSPNEGSDMPGDMQGNMPPGGPKPNEGMPAQFGSPPFNAQNDSGLPNSMGMPGGPPSSMGIPDGSPNSMGMPGSGPEYGGPQSGPGQFMRPSGQQQNMYMQRPPFPGRMPVPGGGFGNIPTIDHVPQGGDDKQQGDRVPRPEGSGNSTTPSATGDNSFPPSSQGGPGFGMNPYQRMPMSMPPGHPMQSDPRFSMAGFPGQNMPQGMMNPRFSQPGQGPPSGDPKDMMAGGPRPGAPMDPGAMPRPRLGPYGNNQFMGGQPGMPGPDGMFQQRGGPPMPMFRHGTAEASAMFMDDLSDFSEGDIGSDYDSDFDTAKKSKAKAPAKGKKKAPAKPKGKKATPKKKKVPTATLR